MIVKAMMDYPGAGYDGRFAQTLLMTPEAGEGECQVVNLYPELSYETFEGFGGAVTEAAGYVFSQMDREQQRTLIHRYFSPEEMNYRLVRVHMDSCDFCLGQYEALSDPEDTELTGFSFARTEQYILPMLEAARAERDGDLELMLSPWSPPAFMKTTGRREQGGRLKPAYRGMWAKYICRYIQEFRKRGFRVQRISLQNESNAVQTWDSCQVSAQEEKEFLQDFLWPEMGAQGLRDVEVFIWDHNKERLYERVRDTVDDPTAPMVSGAAFHWYSGDHFEALDLVKHLRPDLKLILSESCLEYRLFGQDNMEASQRWLCHEIISDLRHGMQAMYDWNLLLDQHGGPNYAGNFAHAAFMYDTDTGELKPQTILKYTWQLSHYLREGSVRIASTCFTEALDTAAYRTPDGKFLLIAFNKSTDDLPVTIRLSGLGASLLVPVGTVVTCILEKE